MEEFAEAEHLAETQRALVYMKEKHEGQYRKAGQASGTRVPYIIHPLMMACHAHALHIRDDRTLAAILLHDVCEDCGVRPEELPFSDRVKELVDLLTFRIPDGMTKQEATEAYYRRIRGDSTAVLIKALDRCNNVSTMAHAFSVEKMVEYIEETETYVLPMLKTVKSVSREYDDAAFVLKYHMVSVLESLKNMLAMYKVQ
ncbi:MAG: HD domain-containing protein [Eubacteriales bacterium]